MISSEISSWQSVFEQKIDMLLRTGYLPTFWTLIESEDKVNTNRVKEPRHADPVHSEHPINNAFRKSKNIDNINSELFISHTMGLLACERSLKLTYEQSKIQYNTMRKTLLTTGTTDTRSVGLRILCCFSHQKSSIHLVLMKLHNIRGRSLVFSYNSLDHGSIHLNDTKDWTWLI